MQVGVKRIRDNVVLPEYGTERSACADIRACFGREEPKVLCSVNTQYTPGGLFKEDKWGLELEPGARILVPTGLIFDIPEGYSLRVHPRSGLSFKKGLTVVCGEGVIDEDYQNELFVPMINLSDVYVEILEGDRIAQIELVKDERCTFGFVEELSEKNSSRDGGFGHTGTR